MREVSFSVSLTSCTNLVLYALTEKENTNECFVIQPKVWAHFTGAHKKLFFGIFFLIRGVQFLLQQSASGVI